VTLTLQGLQKHSEEFEDSELNRSTESSLVSRSRWKEAGICVESDSEGHTLEESSETQSTSSYTPETYNRRSLSTEQLSGFLNDDLIDFCCSESKSRLDEHHIFINRLVFQYQELAASVEELKAGHDKLCHCSENRGHVVSELVRDSEVQHAELMHMFEGLHSSMETELNMLNHDFNEMQEHLETLREQFESQRIEHTSLTADCGVWCSSMRREFNTLGQDNEELCRRMKSLEEEFDAKNIEHSYRLREQVMSLEAKIVECNGKVESHQNEFVASHQQLGIATNITRGTSPRGVSLFPMTSQSHTLVTRINPSRC